MRNILTAAFREAELSAVGFAYSLATAEPCQYFQVVGVQLLFFPSSSPRLSRLVARGSTGPITEEGKQRSRCNAIRHGLTAETVIGRLRTLTITKPSKRPSLQVLMPRLPLNANWCCD